MARSSVLVRSALAAGSLALAVGPLAAPASATAPSSAAQPAAPAAAPAAVDKPVYRVSGDDRYGTTVEASKRLFAAGDAQAVVLARGDTFPDALSAATLAKAKNGDLLLTKPGVLPTVTAAELVRVLPKGGTVYVIGGPDAVRPAVTDAVVALGYQVVRLYGHDRYDTSLAVAHAVTGAGAPDVALVTTGENWPDALSAATAAAHLPGEVVLLLTQDDGAPDDIADYLDALPSRTDTYAIGGPAAMSPGIDVDTNLVGSTRYTTATAVARAFFLGTKGRAPLEGGAPATQACFSTGFDFPDSLAGSLLCGSFDAPLIPTPPSMDLNPTVEGFIDDYHSRLDSAFLLGGDDVMPKTVFQAIQDGLND